MEDLLIYAYVHVVVFDSAVCVFVSNSATRPSLDMLLGQKYSLSLPDLPKPTRTLKLVVAPWREN